MDLARHHWGRHGPEEVRTGDGSFASRVYASHTAMPVVPRGWNRTAYETAKSAARVADPWTARATHDDTQWHKVCEAVLRWLYAYYDGVFVEGHERFEWTKAERLYVPRACAGNNFYPVTSECPLDLEFGAALPSNIDPASERVVVLRTGDDANGKPLQAQSHDLVREYTRDTTKRSRQKSIAIITQRKEAADRRAAAKKQAKEAAKKAEAAKKQAQQQEQGQQDHHPMDTGS